MIAEFDAVTARLRASTVLANKVEDTFKLDSDGRLVRGNYVVVYFGRPGEFLADRFAGGQIADDNGLYEFTVRCVGVDPGTVRLLLQEVDAQLIGWVPQIQGRKCSSVRFVEGDGTPHADNSVSPPLFFADADFEFWSLFR